MANSVKVISEDCDPSASLDKSLPVSAYMVEYKVEDLSKFDIVLSGRKVDIFDMYYDKFKMGVKIIDYGKGTIKPSLWGYQSQGQGPKKKKRK